ncbi:MAG: hypothetical protein COB17_11440 [Sulfurimonas sp.]|nr:MAG: hypothetical protein COB17_11440 [Sulfurimonas sp.]
MHEAKAIKTLKYLKVKEIQKHLKNVEYIIMAAPSPDHFKDNPIHFSIFLNTSENIAKNIQEEIFNKFLKDNEIVNPIEIMSQIMPVGFSEGTQDTLMPLLLVKQEDMKQIPNIPMLVMDFLANSENFNQAKIDSLTGWTYSYNK